MTGTGRRNTGAWLALGILAACSPSPDARQKARDNAAAVIAPPGAPAPMPFKVHEKSDLLEFSYSYPAEAAVPAIVDRLGEQMNRTKADAVKMARDDRNSAKQDGYPFRPHSLSTEWTVRAVTPRFLSLLSETYVFTGGAHGMTGYSALLWDREGGRETSLAAITTSPAAFAAAIHDRFCDTLDAARAQKRGEPVVRGDDSFSQCIDPLKQVIVPESSNGKAIDRMTVVIGPYEAGPYAEGSYEIPLAVDAAMLKAIKPDYQAAFTTGG